MLFNSLEYIIFLPLVVCLFWAAPKPFRAVILLVASYYFYMSWKSSYGLLLFGLSASTYAIGLALAAKRLERVRKLVFIAGITINLGCLSLFKYTNFFLDAAWSFMRSVAPFLHMTAWSATQSPDLPIILPLGISFFAFEFIHYLTDVHRGSAPIRSPLRFFLFASFFPSQIAGPIKRYQDFDPQVVELSKFNREKFEGGLWLILRGMFKKVALGDNLSFIIQGAFASPATAGTMDAWIAAVGFALQAYFDFSGYTDIGRGSALLLGFDLPENFNLPYLAQNIQEFWRRWHMTLGSWLKDYVFIPLGGSRLGATRTLVNMMITMLLGGLWHGADWHYIIWGAMHGFLLVVSHLWQKLTRKTELVNKLRSYRLFDYSSRLLTFVTVALTLVTFRAENMHAALNLYMAMFSFRTLELDGVTTVFVHSTLPLSLSLYCLLWIASILLHRVGSQRADVAATPSHQHGTAHVFESSLAMWRNVPVFAKAGTYATACCLLIALASPSASPFIYFRF